MIDRLFEKLGGKRSTSGKAPQLSVPPVNSGGTEFSREVFLTQDALAINEARLCHLASLGLDLAGKTVLEVGGGIGLHTCFFESLGCKVTFTDARPENVREAQRRHPHRVTAVVDLDQEGDLGHLGVFDIIYCYGTLYHLAKPQKALGALAKVCRGLILLETCVTPGGDEQLNPLDEPAANPNQAASGLGCRPTRPWVMRQLRDQFGWAYHSRTQPLHPDFEVNWLDPAPRKLYRAVFVGSKQPIEVPTLSATICDLQNRVPDETQGIWLDIGAHLGETTFERAGTHPGLVIYAFEPNVKLAAERFDTVPNYTVLPMAVSEQNGFARFRLNTNSAASSLLPFDEQRLREWVGGEDLKTKNEVWVPTTRLDSFLEALGSPPVDYLKIDTQGADFSVIRSAGDQLAHIRKIKLEVTVTSTQLYQGAGSKAEVVDYLTRHGFALCSEQPQTHGQEENLVFFRPGALPKDIRPLNFDRLFPAGSDYRKLLRDLSDERLLALARCVAGLHPLGTYPGWTFSGAEEHPTPEVRFRQAIWQTCGERKLDKPVPFPWYDGLQLNLYLGNDMSRPTFIGGCIEPNEFVFMESVLKPGMVMLDVGANDGFFTIFAARRVGEAGQVFAFEPSEQEYNRLQANLALNQLHNVRPLKKAVADRNGQGLLRICEYGHEGQNTLGDFVHQVQGAGSQPVELCSLDEHFALENLSHLDFIKIDVEGAEYKVLLGARQLIGRFKPVILLELLDSALRKQGASAAEVIGLLKELGYLIYDFSPATGRLVASDFKNHSDNIVASPTPIAP